MTTIDLAPGDHTIKWSLSGYEPLTATINVGNTGTISCVSVISHTCTEMISIVGDLVIGLLRLISGVTFDSWIESKGGVAAIKGNLIIMGEFTDAYYGLTDIGFTPTLTDMGRFIDYYYGVA